MSKKICVIGSVNIDLVVNVDSFPKAGETIKGSKFSVFPGGKGANQAVAAGKLGGDVVFLGMLGTDAFCTVAEEALSSAGVDMSHIEKSTDKETGIAMISVNSSGENNITIIAGANGCLDRNFIEKKSQVIQNSDLILLQLEIPLETVWYAIEYAYSLGKTIILDPAPAAAIPQRILKMVTVLTPNESELEHLSGIEIYDGESRVAACRKLRESGCPVIINKAGEKGAYLYKDETIVNFGSHKVEVKDTTAAGDTFNAALAVALSQGNDLQYAIKYANAAASLSVTRQGAQSAMPGHQEVIRLMG